MRSFKIRMTAAVTAFLMTAALFTGCGKIDGSAIAGTVGDHKITLGLVNFFARYQQNPYEESYNSFQNYQQTQVYGSVVYTGDIDWSAETEDNKTVQDTYLDDIMTSLENFYIKQDHMKDYGIEISDEEKKAISKAASGFLKANSKEVKEKISADEDTVTEFLTLQTISGKVEKAVKDTADKNVPDEDVAQRRIRYLSFDTTTVDDDGNTKDMSKKEIAAVKKEAQEFLDGARTNGSMEAYSTESGKTSSTLNYGKDYKDDSTLSIPEEVLDAAEKLQDNEFADIIKTDSAYYVIQMEAKRDEEATKTELESVITERENEKLNDTLDKWRDDTKIKVDKKVLAKIKMHDIKITVKQDETEDDSSAESDGAGE